MDYNDPLVVKQRVLLRLRNHAYRDALNYYGEERELYMLEARRLDAQYQEICGLVEDAGLPGFRATPIP
jgi:hypothetical protein